VLAEKRRHPLYRRRTIDVEKFEAQSGQKQQKRFTRVSQAISVK
jgi:hypothetical protein